ncbi:hypothetical protein J2S43_004836 [Catenuloplanes nepalensis]|uniref:Uncharacterized protein n=1 Tax=Catenuloplanes nepalensis TaxID=587533 RepID=A0ABT9MY55_9ACTN|nr:hypothetical protein [Catenuloplanes nepalensis]MDP9796324.1 hypothetical protein [Catenuloplanes nepalensis]
MVTKVWGTLTLGLLGFVLGALWIFEGLEMIEGSSITKGPAWSIAGAILLVGGLIAMVVGVRVRSRLRPPTPAPTEPELLPITEQPTSVSLPAIRENAPTWR